MEDVPMLHNEMIIQQLIDCCNGRRADIASLGIIIRGVPDPPVGCSLCEFSASCGVKERFDDKAAGRISKFITEPRDQIDIVIESLDGIMSIIQEVLAT